MPSDSTLEKPLPNNLDAERSVLGAVILDNNALNAAIENLKPEDFFLDQHRRVFTQMIALGESQQAIDLITLTEELHRRGDLEAAGGAPYLASLADGMPRVSNVEHYARIVKEKAILRNLIHATHNIQQRAFEGEDGADAILDNAESSIFQLAEDRIRVGLLPIKDIVRDNFERLEKIFREGKSITGIPTGYVELDKLTSGLQPSELLILAARPSQGKTALALNLAENIAIRAGQPFLFKPIGDGQCPSRLQALRGCGKELFFLRIVRDGFDGPHHVKSLLKFHLLGVHQDKLCAHAFGRRRLPCHFHLYWRNRNPGCFRAVFFSQVNTAAAEPTSNVEDLAAWPETRCAGDMLNKLILSGLFGLFATNPIAMMNVRAPQTLVIRACTVVEIPDFLFVVIPIHSSRSRRPGN